jgi:YD repeat-containing protein
MKQVEQRLFFQRVLRWTEVFFILLFFVLPCWAENITYTYDALNRLVRVQFANGTVIQYIYDAAGNRTSRVVNTPNPPLSANAGLGQTVKEGNFISPDSLREERDAVDLPAHQ